MPDFPEVPQERVARALEKLGCTVDRKKGKGSHFKVYGPTGKWTLLPHSLRAKGTRHAIAKFLESEGVSLDAFRNEI